MIFITAVFDVQPESAEQWPRIVADFTAATRAEPGNRFFEWSRSLEDPNQYVLVEAFDDDAAEAHVSSDHFRQAQQDLPQHLVSTPRVISQQLDQDGWDELAEMAAEGT